MAVTIKLPTDVQRRLEVEAARRGVGIEVVIAELAGTLPDVAGPIPGTQVPRTLSFVGIGASGEGTSHRIDELLAEGFGRS